MRHMLFIYNPRAGKGLIRSHLSDILEEFTRHDLVVTVHPTMDQKDALHTMRDYGRRYDMVVCSGGDGTLDEVVTGMMRGGFRTPVGYIPAGSTNDFASSLGIPRQMRQAAASISEGSVFSCDVGRINQDHYFVYVAAFGVFTEVSYKTDQDMKNMLGHLAYLLEGARSLSAIRSWDLTFESEEMSGSGSFILGMVTNSNSVGGFKGITGNDVTLNDGVFEVTLIRMPENIIIEWPAILNALINNEPNVNVITFKTSELKITSQTAIPWTTDGEYGGEYTECVIRNMPRALPIILGQQPAQILTDDEETETAGMQPAEGAEA